MPTYSTIVGNQSFDIWVSGWSGKETITIDGKLVSEKRSFRLVSVHSFTLQDEAGPAQYEVNIGSGIGYCIRKNGTTVASHHRPILRYLQAAGFVFIVLWILESLFGLISRLTGVTELATVQQYLADYDGLAALIGALPLSWWLKKRIEPGVPRGSTM